ncbi:MAG: hypothetical protein JWM78_886 [Verrucomicrobiaceae bacterium]|nr:hypothetical protein [Verrucomicrobiaceae bacterium]
MHGHIQYVRQHLSNVSGKPLNEDLATALRSMRTLLINGLRNADDHVERLHRLSLVGEIDHHLRGS